MAKPTFEGKRTLVLTFRFPFHEKHVSEAKNKEIIRNIVAQFISGDISISTKLDDKQPITDKNDDSSPKNIETISNIFGGAEMLDS